LIWFGCVFLWWLVAAFWLGLLTEYVLCGYKGDKFFHEDFISGCRSEIGARVLFLKKGKEQTRITPSARSSWSGCPPPTVKGEEEEEEEEGNWDRKELAGCVLIFNAKITWSA
jgi:hypothetical protein